MNLYSTYGHSTLKEMLLILRESMIMLYTANNISEYSPIEDDEEGEEEEEEEGHVDDGDLLSDSSDSGE